MNLLSSIKKIKIPKHISQGFLDTLIIVAMTILPTLIGILAALVKSQFKDFSPQYKSGEFLLYSVSFMCSAFLVFSEKTKGQKDWKSNANSFIFIFVGVVSAFYGIMVSVEKPNINIIKTVSIIAIIISMPTFLYSQIINNLKSPDISAQRTNEANEIADAIN